MFIFGKVYNAWVKGQRRKAVVCQKCGTQYKYLLTRVGRGKGSALYNLAEGSASNRAETAAEGDLARRLENETELVPCPKCYWVNQELIDRYRRRKYRGAWWIILAIMGVGVIAGGMVSITLTEKFGYRSRVPMIAMTVVDAVCLSSPLWVLVIRRLLRGRIDPNQTYPRRPTVPPGTPPALVEKRDLKTGEILLEPVVSWANQSNAEKGWAFFRRGQIRFPSVCCICLGEASTVYRSRFKISTNAPDEINLPLCGACASGLRLRWWKSALVTIAVALGLVAGMSMMVSGIDEMGRWFLGGFAGLFVMLLGLATVPDWVCRPYGFGVVDKDRGIIKLTARNPAYTELVIEAVRISDGDGGR